MVDHFLQLLQASSGLDSHRALGLDAQFMVGHLPRTHDV